MDILGYEIDIYLVMAVTAGIFVFGIIYLMSGGLSKKKTTKAKNKDKKEKTTKMVTTERQQATAAEFEEEPQQEPKLAQRPKLASPEKSSALPNVTTEEKPEDAEKTLSATAAEDEQKKIATKAIGPGDEQEKFDVSPVVNAVTAASIQEKAAESSDEQETPAVLQVKATAVAQDYDEEQEEEDAKDNPLEDIFSMDEEEESETANLAASLEDIDLGAIKKLSEEISQMLGRNNSGVPRR